MRQRCSRKTPHEMTGCPREGGNSAMLTIYKKIAKCGACAAENIRSKTIFRSANAFFLKIVWTKRFLFISLVRVKSPKPFHGTFCFPQSTLFFTPRRDAAAAYIENRKRWEGFARADSNNVQNATFARPGRPASVVTRSSLYGGALSSRNEAAPKLIKPAPARPAGAVSPRGIWMAAWSRLLQRKQSPAISNR